MPNILDIVTAYDNFPFYDPSRPIEYHEYVDTLWQFYLPDDPRPHGFIPSFVVESMPWTADFFLDSSSSPKRVQLLATSATSANAAIASMLANARQQNLFKCLKGWRDEQYRVLGANLDLRVERAAAGLFGIMTIGVHMTVYTKTSAGDLKLWIPQRSMTSTTNPGMLDNSVAGGVPAGVPPFECLVREAAEEASLPEELTREKAKAVGCVTEFNIKDGGKGLLQPSVKYVYDMEIEEEIELRPADGEVEAFRLMGVEEAKERLIKGNFKPMCAMVMIDFFIRHAILTAYNESDYAELVARTHRHLPFPTTPNS